MNWYYTLAGAAQGPVDEATLDQLARDGTITASTLVWQDGMPDWLPFERARTPATATSAPSPFISSAAPADTCSLCGRVVGANNLVELLGTRVCAACKPLAVQSLREGAAPVSSGASTWREGNRVVAFNRATLPPRCVKCNAPVAGPALKRNVLWHPAAYYLLIFGSIIIYAIVAIIVRKRATLEIHVCAAHLRRRRNFMLAGWLGALAGFAGLVFGAAEHLRWVTGLSLLFIIVIIGVSIFGAGLVRATRIKDNTVWLAGAGCEFLDSLPGWTGN